MTGSGEDDFIARHFAPFAGPGALGLRDDAALIAPPPGAEIVLTADAVVAGVHFLPDDPPADIARKALRVNLSDLAAKGATPLGFLLTLALPRDFDDADVAEFATGLREDARDYKCALLGGDTVSTPGPLTVSITALGAVPAGRMVPRGGAGEGDAIFVSGAIGDAALGLLALRNDPRLSNLASKARGELVARYRRPQPRTFLIRALRECASAAMDVSDGLVGDLAKMLGLAGLSVSVAAAKVPVSGSGQEALKSSPELLPTMLTGGDDYEVLCAVPKDRVARFERLAEQAGVPVARIGTTRRGGETTFQDEAGETMRLARTSWSHL